MRFVSCAAISDTKMPNQTLLRTCALRRAVDGVMILLSSFYERRPLPAHVVELNRWSAERFQR